MRPPIILSPIHDPISLVAVYCSTPPCSRAAPFEIILSMKRRQPITSINRASSWSLGNCWPTISPIVLLPRACAQRKRQTCNCLTGQSIDVKGWLDLLHPSPRCAHKSPRTGCNLGTFCHDFPDTATSFYLFLPDPGLVCRPRSETDAEQSCWHCRPRTASALCQTVLPWCREPSHLWLFFLRPLIGTSTAKSIVGWPSGHLILTHKHWHRL